MRPVLALLGCCALILAGSGESAVRKSWIPSSVRHRIAAEFPALTYGPTWLRSARLRYEGWSHGREQWEATFGVPPNSQLELAWDVSRLSRSACGEMAGYEEATFTINGVKVYWWASNGEETASRCITADGGGQVAITANTTVPSDETLNTRKRRHHAYLLAKAVAYAAHFPGA